MQRTLSLLVLLLASFTPALAGQAQGTQPYRDTQAGFTVHVPAAWTRTPQALVDQLSARTSTRLGAELPRSVGFHAEAGTNGMPRVLLLVSAISEPSLTERAFLREMLGTETPGVVDEALERLNQGREAPIEVGRITWDASEHLSWMAGESAVGGEPVRILQAMRPVEGWGTVMVTIFSGDSAMTFASLRSQIVSIARSLSIDGRPSPE